MMNSTGLVAERVEQFRDQVSGRLSGELTEDQFKPLRLMNGVYLQLHAYMLRIAIPYGRCRRVCPRRDYRDHRGPPRCRRARDQRPRFRKRHDAVVGKVEGASSGAG